MSSLLNPLLLSASIVGNTEIRNSTITLKIKWFEAIEWQNQQKFSSSSILQSPSSFQHQPSSSDVHLIMMKKGNWFISLISSIFYKIINPIKFIINEYLDFNISIFNRPNQTKFKSRITNPVEILTLTNGVHVVYVPFVFSEIAKIKTIPYKISSSDDQNHIYNQSSSSSSKSGTTIKYQNRQQQEQEKEILYESNDDKEVAFTISPSNHHLISSPHILKSRVTPTEDDYHCNDFDEKKTRIQGGYFFSYQKFSSFIYTIYTSVVLIVILFVTVIVYDCLKKSNLKPQKQQRLDFIRDSSIRRHRPEQQVQFSSPLVPDTGGLSHPYYDMTTPHTSPTETFASGSSLSRLSGLQPRHRATFGPDVTLYSPDMGRSNYQEQQFLPGATNRPTVSPSQNSRYNNYDYFQDYDNNGIRNYGIGGESAKSPLSASTLRIRRRLSQEFDY